MKQELVLSDMTEEEKKEQIDSNIALRFSSEVFDLLKAEPNLTPLEALSEICSRHSVDEEDVTGLLTPKLLAEIRQSCEDLKLVRKSGNTTRLW